jgi:predicted nucleic acid-binding protein
MRYWDASAIVPLLVQESRTNDARAALAEDAGIVTWWGTRIECTSAIARLERAASLTPRQASQAVEVLRALASGWNEILPAELVREAACRLLRVHSLRSADAIQLAAATVMAGGRTAHVGFLAFDDRLREAASREGFRVGPD